MVLKIHRTIKYELTQKGIESIAAIHCILNHVAPALLSTLESTWIE